VTHESDAGKCGISQSFSHLPDYKSIQRLLLEKTEEIITGLIGYCFRRKTRRLPSNYSPVLEATSRSPRSLDMF